MLFGIFQGKKISQLGFGTMRLPMRDGAIDVAQVEEMVGYALSHGVNYFDTAFPYHGGLSEKVIGKALSRYPRESYFLATKYPGHQISASYDPEAIFEEQLKKCGVDYFDFYLLHNVCENSIDVYRDPQWGIVEYFVEQKRKGRIRHLGFSSHGQVENLRAFLDEYGQYMEFCQIQLNYLDWTLQNGKEKYELLCDRSIPIWVMEPVRGGKLASLGEESMSRLRALRPEASAAEWSFRWLQDLPGVQVVLSGMSDMAQMRENIETFREEKPLSIPERETLFDIAEGLKNALPCTGCRYCVEGCPMGLDIPRLIGSYNDIRVQASFTVSMFMDSLPKEKLPSACIGCGACAHACPQKIDIPAAISDFAERLKTAPNWTEICRQREEAARQARETNE